MARIISTPTIRLIRALQVNEWSDKAREASAKKRKEKAGGSWWKTAGKAALIGGGALAGAALGLRGGYRYMSKTGRLLKAGEDVTGKILAVGSPGRLSEGITYGGKPVRMILEKASKGSGVKGKIARAIAKVDDKISLPSRHYGVGTGPDEVTHVTLGGSKPYKDTKHSFKSEYGGKGAQTHVIEPAKTATPAEITERLGKASSHWGRKSMVCEGKNCEMFAREVAEGRPISEFRRTVLGMTAGGAALGATPGVAMSVPRRKKQVHNLLQVINKWSDEARKKSAEVRRARKTMAKGALTGAAISSGANVAAQIRHANTMRGLERSLPGLSPEVKSLLKVPMRWRIAGAGAAAIPGALMGLGAGALLAFRGAAKRAEHSKKLVKNVLQVINGGPGSGHHGHKGIKGHRGGSLPEGSSAPSGNFGLRTIRSMVPSAPLSESPQARAKRIKTVYTKSSRLADTYGAYAEELEKKRKRRFLPLKKSSIAELKQAHAKAAENFYASADQATLTKGRTQEEQVERLRRADYHAQQAMRYHKRLTGKEPGALGKFTRTLGKAFVAGITQGTAQAAYETGRHATRIGVDIAAEGVRGGVRQAVAKPEKRQSISDQIKAILKATGGAAKERATAHRDEFLRPQDPGIDEAITTAYIKKYMQDVEDLKKRGTDVGLTPQGRAKKPRGSSVAGRTSGTRSANEKAAITEILTRKARGEDVDAEEVYSRYGVTGNELTANFSPVTANLSGQVRRETLHDREYLVAPLSMIVPGVLPGSKGPLLYPEDEVSKNPSTWNNIPIVVNHPMKDGMPVEARGPEILDKYQIGTVFNAKYNGKLVAEGWFDVARTRKTNIGIYEQLVNNKPIELSTGLYTDNEPFDGIHADGRPYKYIARNYRPDHLAILLGSKGACSIKDGCGVLINREQPTNNIVRKVKGGFKLVSHRGKNLGTAKTEEGIAKRERQVEYFKHVKNEELIGNGVGDLLKTIGGKAVNFTRSNPKTALGITAVGSYKLGKRKGKKTSIQRVRIVNALSPLTKKRFKQAAGFGGGLVAGGVGAVKGAGLGAAAGTAIAPGVGTVAGGIIGGAAGAALGAWGASKVAGKVGGRHAAEAASWGGLAGSLASPGGMVKGLAGKGAAKVVSKAPLMSRMGAGLRRAGSAVKRTVTTKAGAKTAAVGAGTFAGKQALDTGTFMGTTSALDKGFGPKVRKPRPAHIQNAWTAAARQKSAETRRRNASARQGMSNGQRSGAAAGGLATGIVAARIVGGKIDKALEVKHYKTAASEVRRVVKRSFEPAIKYTHDPVSGRNVMTRQPVGVGRKTLRLLKRIGPRVGTLLRMIRK